MTYETSTSKHVFFDPDSYYQKCRAEFTPQAGMYNLFLSLVLRALPDDEVDALEDHAARSPWDGAIEVGNPVVGPEHRATAVPTRSLEALSYPEFSMPADVGDRGDALRVDVPYFAAVVSAGAVAKCEEGTINHAKLEESRREQDRDQFARITVGFKELVSFKGRRCRVFVLQHKVIEHLGRVAGIGDATASRLIERLADSASIAATSKLAQIWSAIPDMDARIDADGYVSCESAVPVQALKLGVPPDAIIVLLIDT